MGSDIEIIPEPGEMLQKPDEKDEKEEDLKRFMANWRNSDYYDFVMNVIDNEASQDYLQTIMRDRLNKGESMTNEEIGEQARVDLQVKIRLENLKDTLK